MIYDLPKRLDVCGTNYEIRSDYRAVLDCCIALIDPNLSDSERITAVLYMFYPAFLEMPQEHYEIALRQCFWFINCGEENQNRKTHALMNWEQDFKYIVSPINRVVGSEVRSIDYLHWWSFISAYYEIGDCFFAQIVRIRDKKAKGKKLTKEEREFYRKNQKSIDLKTTYSDAENELLKQWT